MKIGNIELLNVDCIEYLKSLPDKAFDLAICDPPYGIDHATKAGKMAGQQYGNAAAKKRSYLGKDWNKQIPPGIYFEQLKRVSKNQILWGGNYFTAFLEPKSGWIFWDKDNGDNNFSDGELAWTSFDKGLRKVKVTWNGMIQYDMGNKEERFHPTQKPIRLYEWVLKHYAEEGFKILDTHGGSASLGIACMNYKFDAVICEIDKDYFDAAVKRLQNHVAQTVLF